MVKVKRVYTKADKDDGLRILVDRLWPRGLSKEKAKIDLWFKEIAPSDKLRKWFAHKPERWPEFKHLYFCELAMLKDSLEPIIRRANKTDVTLLYGAKANTSTMP